MKMVDYIAVSVAAFRHNGNTLVNSNEYAVPATKTSPAVISRYMNKALIHAALLKTSMEYGMVAKLSYGYPQHDNTPVVTVTDEDTRLAAEYIAKVQQTVIMSTLKGKNSSGFMNSLAKLLQKESLNPREMHQSIGLAIYVPKLGYATTAQEKATSAIMEKSHSQHLGVVGEKLVVKFEAITSIFLRNRSCYLVKGNDDHGNLILFFSGKPWTTGKQIKIKGRVKRHEKERDTNYDVTILNYVKEL